MRTTFYVKDNSKVHVIQELIEINLLLFHYTSDLQRKNKNLQDLKISAHSADSFSTTNPQKQPKNEKTSY